MRTSSRRPSLMFVMGLAPKKIGGIENFLRRFVIAMDAAGWDSVLCLEDSISQEFRDYVAFDYVTIEPLNHQEDLGFGCAVTLWRLLRKYKPQTFVYAFHGVMRCFPWVAKAAGSERIFFNDHSSRPPGQVAGPLSLPKRIVGRMLTAPLSGICSVSDFTRRSGTALGITSARNWVIPNGVEVRALDLQKRAEFRGLYGIPDGDVVVTQVCWMVDVKGVDTMLRAAISLLRRRAGVHFLFIGEGPKLDEYKKLAGEMGIAGSVTFTGMLSNPTGMGVFDATDIYCQPSVWQEASGLAVLEAMSLKRPVIASDTGGLPEVVRHDVTGILVAVGSREEITAGLERLVNDAALRRDMGEAGYRVVVEEHRIEDTVRGYVELFIGRSQIVGSKDLRVAE